MSDNQKNVSLDEQNKEKMLNHYFKKIETYFKLKEKIILEYKHLPLEEILRFAPRYYQLIRLIEKFNIMITKNKFWLRNFIEKNNIKFDWHGYERWKAGKDFIKFKYTDTQAPSKWIHVLQDYLIDLLESIQILLVIEFHIKDEDYKDFLKKYPKIKHKLQTNFVRPSPMSEDVEKFFEIIDYLLKLNIDHDFTTKFIVDTILCIKVYKEIDKSKIMDLLKQKAFYIQYRLEFLNYCQDQNITLFPYQKDIIKIGENFLKTYEDFKFTHKEYRTRLMEKYEKVIGKYSK